MTQASASRDMVAALRSVGSQVKYTEYPEAEHDVWTLAFAEPALPDWLFAQKRQRRQSKADGLFGRKPGLGRHADSVDMFAQYVDDLDSIDISLERVDAACSR